MELDHTPVYTLAVAIQIWTTRRARKGCWQFRASVHKLSLAGKVTPLGVFVLEHTRVGGEKLRFPFLIPKL